jgi:hypothetical protein
MNVVCSPLAMIYGHGNNEHIVEDPLNDLANVTPQRLLQMMKESHVDGDSCCQVSLIQLNDNEYVEL